MRRKSKEDNRGKGEDAPFAKTEAVKKPGREMVDGTE
jgi:hypothetical protein